MLYWLLAAQAVGEDIEHVGRVWPVWRSASGRFIAVAQFVTLQAAVSRSSMACRPGSLFESGVASAINLQAHCQASASRMLPSRQDA